jgi:hypothetical protein
MRDSFARVAMIAALDPEISEEIEGDRTNAIRDHSRL